VRVPRSWRTRSVSKTTDASSAHCRSSSTSNSPPGSAACASRPRTLANSANRWALPESAPRSSRPASPKTCDSRSMSAPKAGSPKTSRHRPYGGELPSSAARAHATGTFRAEAAAASSSASRVLPIPASPVHSTKHPRPARTSPSRAVTRASSRSRPTITRAASPATWATIRERHPACLLTESSATDPEPRPTAPSMTYLLARRGFQPAIAQSHNRAYRRSARVLLALLAEGRGLP
jgi:hypothetical protein